MPKPIDAVVADLTRETASWDSIGVNVSLKQTRYVAVGAAGPGTTTGNREEYLATASGQRKYAQFARVEGREACVLLGYSDGARCASVLFQPPPREAEVRAVTITRSFLHEARTRAAEIPAALPFAVGLEPISRAIARAEPVGPSRVLDRDCDRYRWAAVPIEGGTHDLVYHLDAATSYPLKVESFADRERFLAGQPTTAWEALRLDEVQGRHVATDSKFTTFGAGAGGQPGPMLTDFHHVDAIRFDAALPAASFWPTIEPGVLVIDRIDGRSYKAGATGKAAIPLPPTPAEIATWTYGTGLVLGLVLFGLGIARRRQARQAQSP